MLQQVKPRNARSARAVAKRESQTVEYPKRTLFLRGSKCSEVANLVLKDVYALKRPLVQRFTRKNRVHPFDDATSLEFFSEKNDTALILFGSTSKKRPHCLTLARCFEHKILDMLELLIQPEEMRTLSQFKNPRKPAVGLKPLVCFAGTPFENPVPGKYTLAKSLLLDLFRGADVGAVDVEGLQYMICISAEDEVEGRPPPLVRVRAYMVNTRKSGQRLPRVEVEEIGPRVDFRLGRHRDADPQLWKEAMKKPRGQEPRSKKNVETDLIGDKMGRIHLGKQDLSNLQTRKMKGLKRSRDFDADGAALDDGRDVGVEIKKPRL